MTFYKVLESEVDDLAAMGFSREKARQALSKYPTLDMALESLLSTSADSTVASDINQARATDQARNSNRTETTGTTSGLPPVSFKISSSPSNSLGNYSSSQTDAYLTMAIEKSLQDQKALQIANSEPEDPNERKRIDGVPVGLKNIGNTCYVNSMIQFYFSIREFRMKLLDLKQQEGSVEKPISRRFVRELQKLFASMSFGPRRYSDPSIAFNTLMQDKRSSLRFGEQEDPTEFSLKFLEMVEEGYYAKPKQQPQKQKRVIDDSDNTDSDNDESTPELLNSTPDALRYSNFRQYRNSRHIRPHDSDSDENEDERHFINHPNRMNARAGAGTSHLRDSGNNHLTDSSDGQLGYSPPDSPVDGDDDSVFEMDSNASQPQTGQSSDDQQQPSSQEQLQSDSDSKPTSDNISEAPKQQQQPVQIASSDNFLKKLFSGIQLEKVAYIDDEQQKKEIVQCTKQEFFHIILDLMEGDLYASLDAYTSKTEIDNYETSTGLKVKASQSVTFEALPPVLSFQLQRVRYDKEIKAAVKIHSKFMFPKVVCMERYLESNADRTARKRSYIQSLRTGIDSVQEDLRSYTDFQNRGVALNEYLYGSILYFEDRLKNSNTSAADTASLAPIDRTMAVLNRHLSESLAQIEEYRNEINGLQQQIDETYLDMDGSQYYLHAVLVHDGAAGFGHYWAFLFDHQQNRWYKFNDSTISIVDEETVWRESTGGHFNTSAYCLVYVSDRSQVDWQPHTSRDSLQQFLQFEIEREEFEFKQELARWEEKLLRLKDVERIPEFRQKFEERLSALVQLNTIKTATQRPSLFSFSSFLLAVKSQDNAQYQIADEIFQEMFPGNKLERHDRHEFVRKLQSEMPYLQLNLNGYQAQEFNYLYRNYLRNCTHALFLSEAIEYWLHSEFEAAIPKFLDAVRAEYVMNYDRQTITLDLMSFCCWEYSEKIKKMLTLKIDDALKQLCILSTAICRRYYTHSPNLILQIREDWFRALNKISHLTLSHDAQRYMNELEWNMTSYSYLAYSHSEVTDTSRFNNLYNRYHDALTAANNKQNELLLLIQEQDRSK